MMNDPKPQKHPKGCWRQPGHHDCAIKVIRRISYGNVIRAFSKRGEMIQHLAQKNAALITQLRSAQCKLTRHGIR